MTPFNPLDWTAGPFLTLYVALLGGVAIIAFWWRSQIGHDPPGTYYGALDALDLAWLTGGRRRAQETVLVGFLASGAAVVNPDRKTLNIQDPAHLVPRELDPFKGMVRGTMNRAMFLNAIDPGLDAVRERLMRNGLVPNAAEMSELTRAIWPMISILVALGAAKVAVGMSRGKPVGILTGLVVATVVLAIANGRAPPKRTRAGTAALYATKQHFARAARAPEPQEMALAYALSGAAVLSGTPWRKFVKPPSNDGGGDGGCGGGDGGGGGGCGGCGGH